jgi:anti-anti-sigma factor
MNALPTLPMPPVDEFVSQPRESHSTRLAHRRLRSSVAVISARGDIDASNADTLTEYTLLHLRGCRGLIIDLSGLDFFGTEGFSALHRISVRCAHPGIAWALVPSKAVSRVLRIGDPQGLLPAARTVEAAMAIIQDQPHLPPRPSEAAEDPDNARDANARCA